MYFCISDNIISVLTSRICCDVVVRTRTVSNLHIPVHILDCSVVHRIRSLVINYSNTTPYEVGGRACHGGGDGKGHEQHDLKHGETDQIKEGVRSKCVLLQRRLIYIRTWNSGFILGH